MKIAIYLCLPPGGAARTVVEQVKGLRKRKHRIDLFKIPYKNNDFFNIEDYANQIFVYNFELENKLPGFLNRLSKDFKNFISLYFLHKRIASDINKGEYSVVLVHSDILTQSPFILRFLKVPTIYYCHEPLRIVYEKELEFTERVGFHKRLYERLTRKLRKLIDRSNAQRANLIVTSSFFIKHQVENYFKKNAICCHSGVDFKVFKPLKVKRKKKVLIPGKSKLKGFDFALKSLRLIDPKIRPRFEIIGDFEGKHIVTEKELVKKYSEAIATLCVAHGEPFGLVALESMACGTPVLAVNEGGFKETVIDGVTGYLIRRNPTTFAEKVSFLMENKGIANKMGVVGREHVIKNFSWEEHIDCLEKYLEQVIVR